MKIECPKCHKGYEVPEERLKSFGDNVSLPCPACKTMIAVSMKTVRTHANASAADQRPPGALTGEALKRMIMRTLKELPPMPQVAQKARQLAADENASFTDLARVIETDQAIAARVLKLANSSYYGVAGSVTSIQHAAVVLGMKTLNELLTMACASSMLSSQLNGYGLASGDLWKHSLAVAECARSLATRRNPSLVDDAFSAGLIHDCGKLILDAYILERKEQFDRLVSDGQTTFLEAEKQVLGFDHAELAADVCEKWQIPKKLSVAIQYHHMPSALEHNELAYIVHAADAIALMSGIGSGVDGMMYRIDDKSMSFLELDNESVSMYMAQAVEYVEKTVSGV